MSTGALTVGVRGLDLAQISREVRITVEYEETRLGDSLIDCQSQSATCP